MAASTPTMVTGYTNLSINDQQTTSAANGDGGTGFDFDGAVIWYLTRVLLLIGAICTGSSTRTSGTGAAANAMTATDQWAAGVYTAAYNYAWWACKITLGGVQYNIVFQVGGVSIFGVRAKMSVGAGNEFTNSGGSVSATRTKYIATEHILTPEPAAAGTDASPSFATMPNALAAQYLSACWDAATGYLGFEMHPSAGGTKASNGFIFAVLPFTSGTYKAARADRVFLISPGTLLDCANLTESGGPSRAVYYCQKNISPALAAVHPSYRLAAETTSADPAGDKIDDHVSWSRDTAPTDSGGLTEDCLVTGQVISAPTMHDARIDPDSTTKLRYLCLGNLALRFPNSFTSN